MMLRGALEMLEGLTVGAMMPDAGTLTMDDEDISMMKDNTMYAGCFFHALEENQRRCHDDSDWLMISTNENSSSVLPCSQGIYAHGKLDIDDMLLIVSLFPLSCCLLHFFVVRRLASEYDTCVVKDHDSTYLVHRF